MEENGHWYLKKDNRVRRIDPDIYPDMRLLGSWAPSAYVVRRENISDFACLELLSSGILNRAMDYDCKIKKKQACNYNSNQCH